jgi:predicted nucleic acid-binding protein
LAWAILDTSVYIAHWERGLYQEVLASIRRSRIIRHSAVVLSELRRGARTPAARKLIADLHRIAAVRWEPTAEDWWEAGRIVQEIGDAEGWESAKRRDFQNDTLIALTARRYGSAIVTENRNDFGLLSRELRIQVVVP